MRYTMSMSIESYNETTMTSRTTVFTLRAVGPYALGTIMDKQQLESMRYTLSVLFFDLSRQSMDVDDAGDGIRSDELWQRMCEVLDELRRVDAVIQGQANR